MLICRLTRGGRVLSGKQGTGRRARWGGSATGWAIAKQAAVGLPTSRPCLCDLGLRSSPRSGSWPSSAPPLRLFRGEPRRPPLRLSRRRPAAFFACRPTPAPLSHTRQRPPPPLSSRIAKRGGWRIHFAAGRLLRPLRGAPRGAALAFRAGAVSRPPAAPVSQGPRRRGRPRGGRRVHAPGRARRDRDDLHRQRHRRPHRRQRRRRRVQDDGEHVLAARGDHGVERDLRARHHRDAVGRLRARDPAGQRRPSVERRHGHHRVGDHQEEDAVRQRHHRRRLPPRGGDARAARPRPHLRDPSERRRGHDPGRRASATS